MQDLIALRDKSIRRLEDTLQLSGGEPPRVRRLCGAELVRLGVETLPALRTELAPVMEALDMGIPERPLALIIPKYFQREGTILGRIAAYDTNQMVDSYVGTLTRLMLRYEPIFGRLAEYKARNVAGVFEEFSNTFLVRELPEPFLQEKTYHELTHWLSARANPAFGATAKLAMLVGKNDAQLDNGAAIHCLGEGIAIYTAGKLLEQEFSKTDLDVVNLQPVRQDTAVLRKRLQRRCTMAKRIPRIKPEEAAAAISTIFCLRHSHELGHDYVRMNCKNADWAAQIRSMILNPEPYAKGLQNYILHE